MKMTKCMMGLLITLGLSAAVQAETKKKKTTESAPVYQPVVNTVPEYFGSESKYEVSTSLMGGTFTSRDSITTIDIQGNLLYNYREKIQVGGYVHFENQSGGNSYSGFSVAGIGVYNFKSPYKDSLFAKAGLGSFSVPDSKTSERTSKFGFVLGAGKRFSLFENLTYTPELRIYSIDSKTTTELTFINFSYFFNNI